MIAKGELQFLLSDESGVLITGFTSAIDRLCGEIAALRQAIGGQRWNAFGAANGAVVDEAERVTRAGAAPTGAGPLEAAGTEISSQPAEDGQPHDDVVPPPVLQPVAQPRVATEMPTRYNRISAEQLALLRRDWPTIHPSADILRDFNALPGVRPRDTGALGTIAAYYGLRRPPRDQVAPVVQPEARPAMPSDTPIIENRMSPAQLALLERDWPTTRPSRDILRDFNELPGLQPKNTTHLGVLASNRGLRRPPRDQFPPAPHARVLAPSPPPPVAPPPRAEAITVVRNTARPRHLVVTTAGDAAPLPVAAVPAFPAQLATRDGALSQVLLRQAEDDSALGIAEAAWDVIEYWARQHCPSALDGENRRVHLQKINSARCRFALPPYRPIAARGRSEALPAATVGGGS